VIFVGVDSADTHHDVHVEDVEGKQLLAPPGCPRGWRASRFHALVGGLVEDAEAVIGIETDRGLFVAALVGAG
jgi:transposase